MLYFQLNSCTLLTPPISQFLSYFPLHSSPATTKPNPVTFSGDLSSVLLHLYTLCSYTYHIFHQKVQSLSSSPHRKLCRRSLRISG
ncbi:hypothetical protein Hanom_Chr03g00241241 [Helianthus anomalus]